MSTFALFNPRAGGGNAPNSTWFQRVFDPGKVEMDYNAYQASLDRQFSSREAQKAWERTQNSADIAYERSAFEAQKERDWQEYMRNTAYESAVEGMRRAGLNPYALYSMSPASAPSGAVGSAYTASSPTASASGARVSSAGSPIVGELAGSAMSLARSVMWLARFVQ